jgi:uncharacterized protein (DUF433 family)
MSLATPAKVNLEKYIEVRLCEDRPHLRDRRIPVAMIARRMRANSWTVAETAYDFSVTEAEIVAALLYYEEHLVEIEAQEQVEQAKFEAMKREHGAD